MFTRKRKNDDLCHGDVHHYVCKYSRKKKYILCPHQLKIIFRLLVAHGIMSGATPKVILRSLCDHGCFLDGPELSMTMIDNKISHLKKILDLTESIDNTHELHTKIQ